MNHTTGFSVSSRRSEEYVSGSGSYVTYRLKKWSPKFYYVENREVG